MIRFAKIFLCLLLFSSQPAQPQGANAGSEPVNHEVCDQTPAQGMAPYAPDMCRNPLSGGQISRKYLEENPRYAERVRKKLEEDARQRQKNRAEHQESLAAQEDNRNRQEQARVAYWAKQEQESRVARELADAESKRRIAAQDAERERQQQANTTYWAKKDQENRTAQALADAERRKNLAAQKEEQKRQQPVGKEVWYKPVVVPAPSVTTPAPSVTTPAPSRVTPAPSTITHAPSRDTPAPSGFVPTPFAYVPPPQVITSGASGYVPSQPVITPAPSKVTPAPSSVMPAGRRDYRKVQPQSVATTSNAQPLQATPSAYQNVLTPQEIEWNNSLPYTYRATTQFSPTQIAEIKKDGRWGPWVAQTKADVAGQGRSVSANQKPTVAKVNTTPNTQPAKSLTYADVLTPQEIAWINSLPSGNKTKTFSPEMIDRMKKSGHWPVYVQGTNNDIAAQKEAKWEEQKAWAEFTFNVITLPVGELKIAALAISKGPVIAKEAVQAGRKIIDVATEKEAGATAARGVDAAGTGGINIIGGRTPINSRYANDIYPLEKLPPALQEKYPYSVRFTADGFPDFSPYAKAKVEIKGLTGDYAKDAALANQAVGLRATPDNYVWHHVEDGKTMQLVPSDIHQAMRHTGGAAMIRSQGK